MVISLERLNRILDYDEQLAYITIEPGVTFAQAQRFLREQRSNLMLNSPGSTTAASIIGNIVERGVAGGLEGDRVRQVCNLQVVLPNGDCIETGFGRFESAVAARVFAHGLGPSLDGLFVQSNLGVVTKLTLWLTPQPGFSRYFSFAIASRTQLPELIDALQAIKREGLVQTNFGLYNDYKLLTYLRQFPSTHSQEETLNLSELPSTYRAPLQGCAWFGEGAITAPNEEIGAAFGRLLNERLSPKVAQLIFNAPGQENALIDISVPTSLASVYWRKGEFSAEDMNPDRDRCGLIWLCPVAVFRGDSVARCVSLIEDTLSRFHFEPIVSLQCHSPRSVQVIASIVYDRDQPGHDAQALAAHDALLEQLTSAGFIPYRLSTYAMSARLPSSEAYAALLRSFKELLDCSSILAPGRYD